ncbi:DUF4007 family protein [Marinomonas foliarum]|uniref:Uncharacterized protein DUF4007 n=1 Tax=Marinomonas foliarum TaxID=491950 RepID=A0A368ZQC8_9GAMM|nr:DUF4007 family protein [Marinomonas foliarum]RCW96328.1 uncharacterized protein DUF4007 [Marinomonas foliarum]
MIFNPDKMAFGRHETFALRYGWLSKGFQAMEEKKGIFESDDATVRLGVGKNMVIAIKYWLRACQMIDPVENIPTDLGGELLSIDGFDPYLEDEATIWLLHWLLATNAELATSWFWFFNRFHKPEFTGQELGTALTDFVNDKVVNKKKPAAATLSNDASLIPRMYTQSTGNGRTPIEDALDSPFSLLKLVTQSAGGRSYQSRPMARPDLPIGILGYAVCGMFDMRKTRSIPIEDFMYSKDNYPAIGSVFRLTESDLVTKLEKLVDYIPGIFDIRDTAGQHQLFLSESTDAMTFIVEHYNNRSKDIAA